MRTAESAVLTPCPPGPEARKTATRISSSRTLTSTSSTSGTTASEAKLVCRRREASNGEIRTSRCTPISPRRYPNAYSPDTSTVADLMPASSPGSRSTTSAFKPARSHHLRYIRSSICAQSCDSVPPAPGWIDTIAAFVSWDPESMIFISNSSRSFRRPATEAGVDGLSGAQGHALGERRALVERHAPYDLSGRCNERRHPGVRRAHHRDAVLDRAEGVHGKMLPRAARTAEPSVVRHVYDQARPTSHEFTDELGEYPLLTDCHGERCWRDR